MEMNLTLAPGWRVVMLALAAYWWLFFQALSGEWGINPQYNYGYVVPLLGLMLCWRRWPTRPPARPPASPGPLFALGAGLLLGSLPLRVLLEANPEWRLIYWVQGVQVIALTLGLFYRAGGWPWVRYFAVPVAFMLIATPWPMEVETALTQGLMRWVAGLTVEVANWLCPPAVQHGNLIEVSAGVVGVDEACSGVRSLQSALMLSLFLGELHRFGGWRRLALLGLSLVCVLAANLTRTTFLVWTANRQGLRVMEARHDWAGLLVMLIVLPSLLALAHYLRPRTSRETPARPAEPLALPPMPAWTGWAGLAWLGVVLAGSEGWYRLHERNLTPSPRWTVAWPAEQAEFRKTPLPERALTMLRCSDSDSACWTDADGNRWSGFLLRWKPGRNSAQLAKGHRPDICFPASGARLVEDYGQVLVPAAGMELSVRHQDFETGAGLIHAFYCLWSDRVSASEAPLLEDNSRRSRWAAVWAGKRNLGQQVLEITIQGPQSGDEALELLKTRLPAWVRRQ